MSGAETVALQHHECTICLEPLCFNGPGGLVDSRGKRVCPHNFHCACVQSLGEHKQCPLCRIDFARTVPLPNPQTNPREWFSFVDVDGSGSLEYQEVTDGLLACLPLDWRRIEADMDKLFPQWAVKGRVDLTQFSKPDGVLSYIMAHYAVKKAKPEPPDLRAHREDWFRYWDVIDGDGNGKLDKGEICRALIKTLHLSGAARSGIGDTLDNIWCLFDHDGSGSVELSEFIARDGLADTLIAELNRM